MNPPIKYLLSTVIAIVLHLQSFGQEAENHSKIDTLSKICSGHVIVQIDSSVYALVNLLDSSSFRFEYIPMPSNFIRDKIFDAEYEAKDILVSLMNMYGYSYRPFQKKSNANIITSLCGVSEYLSCVLIEYTIQHKSQFKKLYKIDKKNEKQLRKVIKKGKIVIE